jgi:hypothetical protein
MSWSELYGEWILNKYCTNVNHPFDTNANGVALEIARNGESITVFVFEDPNDGYRSSATPPLIAHCSMYEYAGTGEYIRVPVLISFLSYEHGNAEGIEVHDRRNGKLILQLGTNNTDDYYPYFTAEWKPENIEGNEEIQRGARI